MKVFRKTLIIMNVVIICLSGRAEGLVISKLGIGVQFPTDNIIKEVYGSSIFMFGGSLEFGTQNFPLMGEFQLILTYLTGTPITFPTEDLYVDLRSELFGVDLKLGVIYKVLQEVQRVTPYFGVGIDIFPLFESISGYVDSYYVSESASATGKGFHILAGIDLPIREKTFGFFAEMSYSYIPVETEYGTSTDLGGLAIRGGFFF